jgi:hypothetical protein
MVAIWKYLLFGLQRQGSGAVEKVAMETRREGGRLSVRFVRTFERLMAI